MHALLLKPDSIPTLNETTQKNQLHLGDLGRSLEGVEKAKDLDYVEAQLGGRGASRKRGTVIFSHLFLYLCLEGAMG